MVPSQLTQPAIDFSTVGGAFANEPPEMLVVPVPVVPPPAVVPPLVEPTVVVPPAAVLPPDVFPPAAPLPVVPPRLMVPVALAVSELVPLLDPHAASETLIATTR